MNEPRFWIVVASLDHVELSVAGRFVEVNHGKAGPLERMRCGDGIACYSPRRTYPDGEPLQAFTALGRVAAAPIVQSPLEHQPFRRAVAWLPSSHAPVRPLLDSLGFVANRAHWGAAFRFGFLRIGAEDFLRIATAMACPFELAPPSGGAEPGTPSSPARRRAVRPLPAGVST
jgi:hypothetical protein